MILRGLLADAREQQSRLRLVSGLPNPLRTTAPAWLPAAVGGEGRFPLTVLGSGKPC